MLQWKTITSSYDPKWEIKGTHIEAALCGQHKRYQVIYIRAYDADRNMTGYYSLRDAATVSDAQVKAGVKPKEVFWSYDLDAVLDFVNRNP